MNKDDIKSLRRTLRISQQELGNRLGVGRSTICSWECGKNVPKGMHAESLQAIFDDYSPKSEAIKENPIREKNDRYRQQEKAEKSVAARRESIQHSFTVGDCYIISENRLPLDANILQHSILRYERKEGIHHVFREIRGKWIVTYTDAQLIGKYVEEVNINNDGSS